MPARHAGTKQDEVDTPGLFWHGCDRIGKILSPLCKHQSLLRRIVTFIDADLLDSGGGLRTTLLFIILFYPALWLVSCDSGFHPSARPEMGKIQLLVEWPEASTLFSSPSNAIIDCDTNNIATLSAKVFYSDTLLAEGGPWYCAEGHGQIGDLEPGDDRLVILYAYDAYGDELYRGEAPNIRVRTNDTVQVTISMDHVFSRSVSLVENIFPGADSSYPHRLVKLHDLLFFVACDASLGFELFFSEGPGDGAQLLKDIYPLNGPMDWTGVVAPSGFAVSSEWLYFRANDGNGYRIWRTNGTPTGTEPVAIPADYANPNDLTVLDHQVFFTADSSAAGRELWVYDENTGQAQLVADIYPGATGSNPHELTIVKEALYFVADDGEHGYEIWQTDGTAEATVLTADLYSGAGDSFPSDLIDVNGRLIFVAHNGGQNTAGTPPTYHTEIWMIYRDADIVEVQLVADINPSGASYAKELTWITGTTLAFSAYEPSTGHELYLYDWQTDTVPRRITDLNLNEASSHPANFIYMNGTLFFTAHNYNGVEHLWAYPIEQSLAPRCLTATFQNISPRDLTVFDSTLYFSGQHPTKGRKLWATDGIRAGLVVDANNGATRLSPSNLIAFPDRLYYTAFDAEHGEEVFNISIP